MLPGIGVFGTSEVVKVLIPLLKQKGFNIVAIWGAVYGEVESLAKELSIQFYTNKIDDVLLRKDVDLIFVLCPPYLHSQISVKALGIGKHVVCNGMGLGQSDAMKMVRACQYYPSLISIINHSLRFLPAFSQMKKAIKEEYLGPIDEISLIDVRIRMGSLLHNKFDWLCDATMGGGVLNLIGGHVIDLITFLTEKRAIKVHGVVRTYTKTTNHVNGIRQVTAPDFCTFQMELDSGIIVTVNIHSHATITTFSQEVIVCGKDGHLIVKGGDLLGHRIRSPSIEVKEEMLYLDVQDLQFSNSETSIPRPYVKGLCKMVAALREAFNPNQDHPETGGWIKEAVKIAANFEDGLYVQAVLDAIRRSSDEKSWIKINILTESPNNQAKFMNAARISAVAMH